MWTMERKLVWFIARYLHMKKPSTLVPTIISMNSIKAQFNQYFMGCPLGPITLFTNNTYNICPKITSFRQRNPYISCETPCKPFIHWNVMGYSAKLHSCKLRLGGQGDNLNQQELMDSQEPWPNDFHANLPSKYVLSILIEKYFQGVL